MGVSKDEQANRGAATSFRQVCDGDAAAVSMDHGVGVGKAQPHSVSTA
jgi:hypothetical protein